MARNNNPYIRAKGEARLSFAITEEIKQLNPIQKANQKVRLSYYGNKIDLPFKLFDGVGPIELIQHLAVIPEASHETKDSYKVEIKHPLGTTYFRKDIPHQLTASTMSGDAFAIADLNMKVKKEFEDYLIDRKQYDFDYREMDLSHRQARLARKYEYVNKSLDLVVGAVTAGISTLKATRFAHNMYDRWKQFQKEGGEADAFLYDWYRFGLKGAVIGAEKREKKSKKLKEIGVMTGAGAYVGINRFASGIAGLAYVSEKAALQEEGFGIELEKKALKSYTIDLAFEREKEEQLLNMRRIFADQSYNDVADRQKQLALDKLEKEGVADIYLELWTTSGEQQSYLTDYHDKFGVDCRVANYKLNFRDEIARGIYCIEDVVIENLTDRVELEFLKARLTGGIKFVEWIEHENIKELTQVDERILELQDKLAKSERETEELKRTHDIRTEDLSDSIASLTHNRDQLSQENKLLVEETSSIKQELRNTKDELTNKDIQMKEKDKQVEAAQQAQRNTESRMRMVRRQLEEKEEEAKHYKDVSNLYLERAKRDETTIAQQKSKIEEQTQTLLSQKDELTNTKSQLDAKTQEVQRKDAQIQQDQQQLAQKEQLLQQIRRENRQYLGQIRQTIHTIRGTLPQGPTYPITLGDRQITKDEELIREGHFQEDLEKAQAYLRQELEKEKQKLETANQTQLTQQQEIVRLKESEDNKAKELEQCKKDKVQAEKDRDWNRGIINAKNTENGRLKRENQQLTREKQSLQAQIEELKKKPDCDEQAQKTQELMAKVTELEGSLSAVREIEKQWREKVEELKKKPTATAPAGFYNDLFNSCCSEKWGALTLVIKTTEYDSLSKNYCVAEWNNTILAFTRNKPLLIWNYDSYRIFTIGERNKLKEGLTAYWDTLDISYFNQPQTTWQQLLSRKIVSSKEKKNKGYASAYRSPIIFIEEENSVPYFAFMMSAKEGEMIEASMGDDEEEGITTMGSSSIELVIHPRLVNKGLYWDDVNKRFTKLAQGDQGKGNRKIENYKDYLEVMGIDKSLISRSVIIDEEEWEKYKEDEWAEDEGRQEKLFSVPIGEM